MIKKITIIGFLIILVLSLYVTVFGGGQDLYEMLEDKSWLNKIVFIITSLSLVAMGYAVAIILITWVQAIIRWLKELRKGAK